MGVRRFTDLKAWQHAAKLSEEVDAVTARTPTCKDLKFCDQARDSAASAPRNLAEGFGRFGHREFAHFVNIARASLLETQNHLLRARLRGYLTEQEFTRVWDVSEEAVATATGLLRYLRRRESG